MWISRLRVTGGFLVDLDINFAPGLNVVIGARGAGKTTLLELLRHALGAQHGDPARAARQKRFVAAMLGAGEVIVDLEDVTQSHRLVVDANGGGQRQEFADAALVLGQNELEAIATTGSNRLALIDRRARVAAPTYSTDDAGALTASLAVARGRLGEMNELLSKRPLLEQDFEALRQQEAVLLGQASEDLTARREALRTLEDDLLATQQRARRAAEATQVTAELLRLTRSMQAGLGQLDAQRLPASQAAEALLASVVEDVSRIRSSTSALSEEFKQSEAAASARGLELRNEAEPVRASLEAVERGLGEVTARLRRLQGQLAELDTLELEAQALSGDYTRNRTQRDALLDDIEAAAEAKYEARQRVAEEVSSALDERVIVAIEHLADASPLRDYLSRRLQGSNLKYVALADAISRTVLPRQLLEQLENGRSDGLAAIAKIPVERTARVVDYLQDAEALSELAGISLEDRVDFLLRDGATTKHVEQLSTGQKCAVTLPILMTEHARSLVMDQPEDHLDNAYLVTNIVQGILRRSAAPAQTIVASHNANIPVLGSAERVFVLASDGRRGYVTTAGIFSSPPVVEAITALMEGGREAFERRAVFYASHGTPE